ncbi:MAG: iron-containing alcohol dehydrogenase [Desulfobacteraceae bacterium]|nr:iron-containing alcohol dehydrogenase [Desulfobacteraceae bacterium]
MKKTRFVPTVLFGEKCFDDLDKFIDELYTDKKQYTVYIIDSVHQETGLRERLKTDSSDLILEFNASMHEPKTSDVDDICKEIVSRKGDELPRVVVGIGGGSAMDVAKAVSVMLTNPGSSADYQGWDLVKNKPVPKIAVPTLSGTGAEATRTAVLTGPVKKLGINSDYSIYDAALLDPELLKTVPTDQEFFSGMDNFIHCVEASNGSAMNAMGKPFAIQAKAATEDFFLKEKNYGEYMVGSFLGGCSIANSSVGICHALSYGIAFILGYRHGIANSIVFNYLDEFYGDDVLKFREMVEKNNIELPARVTRDVTSEQFEKMISLAYMLERDLISALGPDFKKILTPEKILKLYEKM